MENNAYMILIACFIIACMIVLIAYGLVIWHDKRRKKKAVDVHLWGWKLRTPKDKK